MPASIDVDVLISGAGPTGLALAGELRRLGVEPMILDRQAAGANTSRAAVIHARTLEVLEPLGVTPRLLAQGVEVPRFRVRDRDRTLITIDFANIPSDYKYTLMCPQDRTERILGERLAELGGAVERPVELVDLVEREDRVEAQLRTGAEIRTVTARWLVGCDGMHSRVRERAGIAFAGAPYEQSFVLADVHMDWPLTRDEVTLFLSHEGLVVVAPLPEGRHRIVATVDAAPESPSVDFMQELLDTRGPVAAPGFIRDVVWSSRFRVHHRVADRLRQGRVLLCGDAAHVHSPAGGQGMNTGIQDGVSLAGALSAVLADGVTERLDAWAEARHEVAQEVVAFTDRLTKVATVKSRTGKAVRNAAIGMVGRLPMARAAIAKNLAELNIR
jgi:2-polyprenyl-6-methoxyphenol hydroxylase-like FAD-dependent oxidoreductase